MKDAQAEVSRIKDEAKGSLSKARDSEEAGKEARSAQDNVEREFALYKRNAEEEAERQKARDQRRISTLEKDLQELRDVSSKTQANESSTVIENRKLAR